MGFLETHLYGDPSVVPGPVWTGPPPALVKLNCDGAWVAQTGRARGGLWGCWLRDGIGCFISAGGTKDMHCVSALMVAAKAVREALTRCLECGYDKAAVESDSLSLINMLNHEVAMDLEIEGILFDIQCLTKHYHKVEFMYALRKFNQAAHLMAAHVSRIGGSHSWDLVCLEWLFKCLAQDVNCSVRI